MTKFLAAAIAAVLLGGAAILISGITISQARSTPPAIGKGDRLDAKPYGAACSQQAWPYYEANCLRNTVGPTREARMVRLVTTDHIAR